jgi:hypothetical protein
MDTPSVARRDYRDILIIDLAAEVTALEQALLEARADGAAYRLIAQTALAQLYRLTVLTRHQAETIVRLHEVLREQRQTDRERAA